MSSPLYNVHGRTKGPLARSMSLPKSVSYQFVNMYVLDDEPTNDKFTEHVRSKQVGNAELLGKRLSRLVI